MTDSEELASVVHDLGWTVQRLDPVESLGIDRLPMPELTILKEIEDNPDISNSAVADRLRMQPSNVSAAVRVLVARGLVARTPSPADKRVVQLRVTDSMLTDRDLIRQAWSGRIIEAIDALPAQDREQLMGVTAALGGLVDELRRLR
ncbi:MarR family transcriptional regulator [Rhodococcus sp. SBT000017]|uniref:MarR family winged helix-turn-helix transcriptional regulator n=1 Tax=Rhodococcus sp. SBT000017 TaxID=1803385 RepID=UPI000EF8756D|nr:helix-turn-helix domain-containing protein [Rhodococcus sp. SBT000017]RMB77737.1 MarR family transcriptional regulator [Rhodococcus sp. SBT000017]